MKMRYRRHNSRNATHYRLQRTIVRDWNAFIEVGAAWINWYFPRPLRAKRIRMLPSRPKDGQLWFDPTRSLAMRYSGSQQKWVEVGNGVG